MWVTNAGDDLGGPLSQEGGALRVIDPQCARRKARWAQVLGWYDGLPRCGASEVRTRPGTEDIVAVVGGQYTRVARPYARAFDRPVVELASLSEAGAALRGVKSGSVMLIADARELVADARLALGEALQVPWSVVPTRDEAGLSFTLAKMSLARARFHPCHGVADGLWNRLTHLHDARSPEVERGPSLDSKLAFLNEASWGMLAVIGHGRGGHMDLHDVVLCSLLGDAELDLQGRRLRGGCSAQGAVHCKRARAETRVVRLTEVRAQCLLLLSCLSALAPYEQYPSNTSGIAAFCEGYAAFGMLANSLIPQFVSEAVLSLTLLEGGKGLGAVVAFLNEARRARGTNGPAFIGIGDPTATLVGSRAGNMRAHVLALPERSPKAPTVVRPSRSVVATVAGARDCGLVVGGEEPPEAPADWSREWGRVAERTARVMGRAAECRRVELLLAAHLEKVVPSLPRAQRVLAAVSEARREVHQCATRISELLVATQREGWWRPDFDDLHANFVRAVHRWDRRMAALIALTAHTRALDHALGHGLIREDGERAGPCPNCGAPTFRANYRDVLGLGPPAVVEECLSCGPLGREARHGGRIVLTMPSELEAGAVARIDVEVTWTDDGSDERRATPRLGCLAVSVSDLNDSEPYLAEAFDLAQNPRRLELRLPVDTQPYLKSVDVALVAELSIATRRRTVPCLSPF